MVLPNEVPALRITFVCPPDNLAGGMRVIALHAAALHERGHQVTVLIPQSPGPSLRRRLGTLVRQGRWLGAVPVQRSYFDDAPYEVRRLTTTRPVLEDYPEADVVIATWWETAGWIWPLPVSKGVKVHFVQDYEDWFGNVAQVDRAYALPLAKITISGWLAMLMRQRFQATAVVVANGVDTARFHAPPREKPARPIVGLTYSHMPRKGTDLALAAVALARQSVPDLQLVACAATPVADALPLPAGTDYVVQAPDDVQRAYYGRCAAWLYAARIDGFGLPLLEAMACRTPVIATPAGAAPELLAAGGGILVPPDSPAAMAEAMVQLCQMPAPRWREMSDAAYRTASAHTWAAAHEKFADALAHILRRQIACVTT